MTSYRHRHHIDKQFYHKKDRILDSEFEDSDSDCCSNEICFERRCKHDSCLKKIRHNNQTYKTQRAQFSYLSDELNAKENSYDKLQEQQQQQKNMTKIKSLVSVKIRTKTHFPSENKAISA